MTVAILLKQYLSRSRPSLGERSATRNLFRNGLGGDLLEADLWPDGWIAWNYAEWIDKLDGAGYGWASALTGRLLPAAGETSHLFSFEARRYLLSAWYQRDTGKYERRSCDPVEVFTFSLIL